MFRMNGVRNFLIGCILLLSALALQAQEALMDPAVKRLLDSLDLRISYLQKEMPRLAQTQSPSWFYKQRELDYTIFLRHYHKFLFEEELDEAEQLISSRLQGARKRSDNDAIEFYRSYQQAIAREMGEHQRRYQELFAREKNFKKEFMRYIEQGDEYSINRAIRMAELAIKYAEERQLNTVLDYLHVYRNLAYASYTDLKSEYDIRKLTNSEPYFFSVFDPLVESDSIEMIREAGALINNCLSYASQTTTELDTGFFLMQQKVVNTSISDYFERKGNNADLATLGGQSIIARLDSLNREGIYKWHDKIIVVGHFKPDGKIPNVKKGEAIIDADRRLTEYIRVNRLAKLKNEITMGSTYVIPYRQEDPSAIFYFNPELKKLQYMVCYTRIESQNFTKQVSKFLPPLQFIEETRSP